MTCVLLQCVTIANNKSNTSICCQKTVLNSCFHSAVVIKITLDHIAGAYENVRFYVISFDSVRPHHILYDSICFYTIIFDIRCSHSI